MRLLWILMLAPLAGCATVTRTVDTTHMYADDAGDPDSTHTVETIEYSGAIPPRPATIFDASDPTKGEALGVAQGAIDRGMHTSVSASSEGDVSLSASPAYGYGGLYGQGGYGGVYGYDPSGLPAAPPDVITAPGGYGYVQVGTNGQSVLAQPVVVSVPRSAPVLVPGQKVECPPEGAPRPSQGTPEYDACQDMTIRALVEAH